MATANAIPLTVLAEDARALVLDDFIEAHGEAFFVLVSSPFPASASLHRTRTVDDVREGAATGKVRIGVFPLRRRPDATHPFISIGRTDDNDIALRDETVSRFHAYVKHTQRTGASVVTPPAVWLLQDAGSKNGTTVNGRRVPARGDGPAVALAPGDVVTFGSVSMSFVDAAALVQIARRG